MDLGKIPLLEAITRRMSWLGERQSVLAQNVANADTPGYTAKDVKPPSFAELVSGASSRLPMAVTEPGHLVPVSDVGDFRVVTPKADERSPNGNAVELDDQMMKISDTANDYALTTSLYRQQLGLLKTALDNGSSSSSG
ncbi:MAG TPA: flagellar basal body protein [Stellaceae bacterium]|jgi:flagellar basal-body rod protein FlgB|nr:flagellar basal body protein [Stellaceae bacterium]